MRYLIFICWILASCGSEEKDKPARSLSGADQVILSPEQLQSADLVIGMVEKRILKGEIIVNGTVDVPPQNIVSVSFPLGGYLKSTRLLPGMRVRKGELIAMMEDQSLIQLQQDYLVAKAKMEYLEKNFDRQKILNENNVNAGKEYEQAKTEQLSQRVMLNAYAEKLRLTGINPDKLHEGNISRSVPLLSPINGFVSKVNVNIGKYVNPSDVLFDLINPSDMHAALTVFEKDISRIRPGQKVWVRFVDDPAKEYACEVLLVTKNVDDSRAAEVHCHFEQQPSNLLPGMFLRARISISEQEVLTVPEESVVRYGKSQFLIEKKPGNQFQMLPVETGLRQEGFIELMGEVTGLEGRQIITKNAYSVLGKIKNKTPEEND